MVSTLSHGATPSRTPGAEPLRLLESDLYFYFCKCSMMLLKRMNSEEGRRGRRGNKVAEEAEEAKSGKSGTQK